MKTQQNKKYIAITIGPIDRIMTYTKSLKSFWAASYLMSYIGKTLVSPFFNEKNKHNFLKPHLSDIMWSTRDGIGRFPDQYIFEAEENDFKDLIKSRNSLFDSLSADISKVLNIDENIINTYLQNTIKIYICELNDINQTISVVDQVQHQLDAMECMDCFMAKESQNENYLELYFDKINKSELLLKDAFGDNFKDVFTKGRLFETLIEFSAQGSGKKQNELFTDSIVASLPAKYKYVAYVCADGDNVGKAIGALGVDMSNKLLAFNQEVGNTVKTKNGRVIYAGGDDLLFLSQVDSVFDLIDEIDKLFAEKILTDDIRQKLNNNNLPLPSMSYGVYISYHKHPMGEALAAAENLLSTAKKQGRNRIEFIMRKHSGQSIVSFVDKNKSSLLSKFVELKNKFYTTSQENDLFLHSFSHFLCNHTDVICHLLSYDKSQLLTNYFDSTFDDSAHNNYKEIIKTLISLLWSLSQSVGDKKSMAINQLYAMLRYVELIISKN